MTGLLGEGVCRSLPSRLTKFMVGDLKAAAGQPLSTSAQPRCSIAPLPGCRGGDALPAAQRTGTLQRRGQGGEFRRGGTLPRWRVQGFLWVQGSLNPEPCCAPLARAQVRVLSGEQVSSYTATGFTRIEETGLYHAFYQVFDYGNNSHCERPSVRLGACALPLQAHAALVMSGRS